MRNYIPTGGYLYCAHEEEGECCFRFPNGRCCLLVDMAFYDNKCHFRKGRLNGPNLYELGIAEEPKRHDVVYCKKCASRGQDGNCMIFSTKENPYTPGEGDYCSKGVKL